MTQLLSELRRRNVFRVAAAYLVVGWLVMQVISVISDAAGLPGWADSFALILLLAGLPVAVFIAWAFELTPTGLKPTENVDPEASLTRATGSTLDIAIIAGLGLVAVLMIASWFWSGGEDAADPEEIVAETVTEDTPTPAEQAVVDASIAVLPFADLSPEGDQQYFSDGIAEELLNALAQFPDLRVAARTSAFSFRGEVDLREVGTALGVAHVLEGSVRKSGDRVRITAQLIRSEDGFHLWSETYDRTLTDIFEVQDEIVAELSRVLQFRLGVGAGGGRATAGDVDPNAYEHYLRGLGFWAERVEDDKRWEAAESFRRATEIDPGFADAWASYGVALTGSDFRDRGISVSEGQSRALQTLNRALAINPDTARAHSGLSTYYAFRSLDMRRALMHGQRAVELAPTAAHSNYFYGMTLFRAGDLDGGLSRYDRALTIDPLNEVPLFFMLLGLAENGLAEASALRWEACEVCEEYFRLHFARRVTNHNGSEAEVRAAVAAMNDWLRTQDDGTPETLEQIETGIRVYSDLTGVLLGVEGAGTFFSAELNDEFADTEDAAVLAHLGEDDRAIDVLFTNHDRDGIATGLEYILTPGRYEFPERTRRHPRYHEYWAQPGMAEWAEVRREHGATAGLPLPIESTE
jgi:TolB-like protein